MSQFWGAHQRFFNQVLTDNDGGPVFTRSFYTYVGAPRAIGIRASYKFGE